MGKWKRGELICTQRQGATDVIVNCPPPPPPPDPPDGVNAMQIGKLRGGVCFTGTTLVHTDRGPVQIAEIKVGDRVLARNPETSQLEQTVVIRKDIHEGRFHMRAIEIDGSATLEIDSGHMVCLARGSWESAGMLPTESSVVGLCGAHVVSGNWWGREVDMVFNIAVEHFGNYFVGAIPIMVSDGSELRLHVGADVKICRSSNP